MMSHGAKLRIAGLLAAAAGLLGGLGDILLFSTPGFSGDMFAVRDLPDWRILTGTLLAILVIPFLSLGYWAFSRFLTGVSELFADVVFLGGIYGVGLGSAIHGTVGILVQLVQRGGITAEDASFLATYSRFVIPLYVIFYMLMAAGSAVLAIILWQRKSAFGRWFIILLPLWSNVLVLPAGWLIPQLGDWLLPSVANLSHALLFGVMAAIFWGREAEAARENGHKPA
jgi:hypothetical protein